MVAPAGVAWTTWTTWAATTRAAAATTAVVNNTAVTGLLPSTTCPPPVPLPPGHASASHGGGPPSGRRSPHGRASGRQGRDRSPGAPPPRGKGPRFTNTCSLCSKQPGSPGRSHPHRRVTTAAPIGDRAGTVAPRSQRRRTPQWSQRNRERWMAEAEREKALDAALGQIEKQFGKGSVMRMGDNVGMNIESIPTGALSLDLALGIGGLPRGRIVEIYGPESSGKSTLAMHAVAEAQRNGGICAYIDAEHAMDPVYARAIGVNVDDLLISQPVTGEQALEIADMLIRSGALDILVIDSVAALTPRAEIEGEMGDSHVGLQARLMSQALRKLTGTLNKSDTICIFINQLREKIGVMYGSPEVTPGGRALKFYSSIRLDIRRIEAIKDGADVVGNRTRVTVVKNKCSAPFKQAEFDIMYGKGISREGSLLDVAVELGFVKKSGAWFTYEGEQLGQGRENVKTFLIENPQLMAEINDRVRECLAPKVEVDLVEDALDPDDVPISIDS